MLVESRVFINWCFMQSLISCCHRSYFIIFYTFVLILYTLKYRLVLKAWTPDTFLYYFFINLFPQCQINVWIHFYIIFQLQFVFTFLSCFWLYERHVFLSHMASFYFLEFFWLNAIIVIRVICLWFSRYICCLTYPW